MNTNTLKYKLAMSDLIAMKQALDSLSAKRLDLKMERIRINAALEGEDPKRLPSIELEIASLNDQITAEISKTTVATFYLAAVMAVMLVDSKEETAEYIVAAVERVKGRLLTMIGESIHDLPHLRDIPLDKTEADFYGTVVDLANIYMKDFEENIREMSIGGGKVK